MSKPINIPDHVDNPDAYYRAAVSRIRFNAWKTRRREFGAGEYADVAAVLDYVNNFSHYDPETGEDVANAESRLVRAYWRGIPSFIFDAYEKWGGLTDKQAECAREAIADAETRLAGYAEEEAYRRDSAPAWKSGRQEVTGTVVKITERENDFGFAWKMVFETDDGRKLWATAPSGLTDALAEADGEWHRMDEAEGMRATVRVTVTPSDDDNTFGFGKRPHLVEVVALPE